MGCGNEAFVTKPVDIAPFFLTSLLPVLSSCVCFSSSQPFLPASLSYWRLYPLLIFPLSQCCFAAGDGRPEHRRGIAVLSFPTPSATALGARRSNGSGSPAHAANQAA